MNDLEAKKPECQTTPVSVVVVTYQHERFIERCLESIRIQTISSECEVLIRDDGSSDGTKAAIAGFISKHELDWIFIDEQENRFEEVEPLSSVFTRASGEYIAILEGDDYWEGREKLERQRDFLDAWPTVSAVGHLVKVHEVHAPRGGNHGTIQGVPGWSQRGVLFDCHMSSQMLRRHVIENYLSVTGPGAVGDLILNVLASDSGTTFVLPYVWGNRWRTPEGLTGQGHGRALAIESCRRLVQGGGLYSSQLAEQVRGHLLQELWADVIAGNFQLRAFRLAFVKIWGLSARRWPTLVRFLVFPLVRRSERLQPVILSKSTLSSRRSWNNFTSGPASFVGSRE